MTIKETLETVTSDILDEMAENTWHDPSDPSGLCIARTGPAPLRAINNGWCEDWACKAIDYLGVGEDIWLDDLFGDETISHCVLQIDDTFYDAECVGGTKEPRDLVR